VLEIYVLFFYIPRKIRALAKPRGQSALAWSLIAMGAWIAAEIAAVIISMLLTSLIRNLEENGLFLFATWVISFLAAAGAVSLVFRRLRQMPLQHPGAVPWQ